MVRVGLQTVGVCAAVAFIVCCLPRSSSGQNLRYLFDPSGDLQAQTTESRGVPQILAQPRDQTLLPGDLGSFSVAVADAGGLSYQWQFKGGDIVGATGDALLLTNVTASNEGAYTVVLVNSSGSITSAPAMLFIDANGNGIPDAWELAYFGHLVSGTGDFDGDGVSDLQEYLDGTNPTNALSALYRLNLGGGGTLVVVPNQPAYANGQIVTLTAIATNDVPFHAWIGDVNSRSNTVSLVMNANKSLFAYFTPITFQWTNGLSGDWNTAANWQPNLPPGSNDIAILNQGVVVTLSNDLELVDLSMGSPGFFPTLAGPGALTINGAFNWAGGTLSGTGRITIAPGATLNLPALSGVTLTDRTLENKGAILWSGTGNFNLGNAIITNDAGSIFAMQSPLTFRYGGGVPRFDNAGTFIGYNGSVIASIGAAFNNYGTAQLQGGTLDLFGGGTNAGTILVTTLNLAGGAFGAGPGSVISGDGSLQVSGGNSTLAGMINLPGPPLFSSGSVNITGDYTCTNDLTITGGSVSFNGTRTVAPPTLTLTSGALDGAQTVTVGNLMNWTGGTMSGTGRTVIPADATLNLGGPNALTLATRTLENGGTANWTGLGILVDGGVITNRAGALFIAHSAANINSIGGVPRFDNAGIFRTTAVGATSIGSSLNNFNMVEIQAGTLALFGGGTNAATISVPAGAALNLAGGVFEAGPASVISGAGSLQVNGGNNSLAGTVNLAGPHSFTNGTVNMIGNYTCTSPMIIAGAIVSFNGTGTVAPVTITLTGGILDGAETVTVGSLMNWAGGSMTGTGRTVIPPGAALNLTAGINGVGLTTRTLENGGTMTWSGTGSILVNGGVITNRAGALFNVQNSASITFDGGAPRFDNAGTFRKSPSTGTTSISSSLNNFGLVDIQAGMLALFGGGTNAGTISVPAGTALNFAGGVFGAGPGSVISGAGSLQFNGGSATLAGAANVSGPHLFTNGNVNITGNYTCTNALTIAGATASFNGTGTVAPVTITLTSGILDGAQTVTVGSLMNWAGGGMAGTGRTVISPGATLNLIAGINGVGITTRTLENGGTTTWSGIGSILVNGGVITNRAGALFNTQNSASIAFSGGAPRFDNAGTFRKSLGTGTTRVAFPFTNYGLIDLQSGFLAMDSSFVSASNAVLNCLLAGRIPGTNYGQLQVFNTLALKGGLNVNFANGYLPTTNDSFTLLTAETRSGTFESFSYPATLVTMQLSNTPTSVVALVSRIGPADKVLVPPQISGTNITLCWGALPNVTYRVEVNSTLDPATWTALPGDINSSNGTACIADVLTLSNRFYRIRVLP